MGHAREGIGPCDSHHSHAYCPVPPIRRRPSATPVRRVPAAAAGLLGRAAGASPDVDCGLPPWPTASSSRRRSAADDPHPVSSRTRLSRAAQGAEAPLVIAVRLSPGSAAQRTGGEPESVSDPDLSGLSRVAHGVGPPPFRSAPTPHRPDRAEHEASRASSHAGAGPRVILRDTATPGPPPCRRQPRRRRRRRTTPHGPPPMPAPASSRAALQRQRSFVTRTYLSPILLRVKVRRMGERYVDVGKVRSRSASSRRRYASSSSPRPGAGRHSPPDRTRRRRTTTPAHHGNQAGPLSGRGRCAPQASAPRQDPHGTSEPSGTDPHSPTPSRSGTGLRRAITSAGKSARSRSATRRISRRSSQVTRRKIQPCA